jgi:tRNA(Ile)-lysidine synthase
MLRQVLEAGEGAHVEFRHDGRVLRRFRGELALLPASAPHGEVAFSPSTGAGIDAAKFAAQPMSVRARQGGERMRLAANRPSRTLKNLFQEAGIPPWERDHLPLLYCGEDLVWVPGLGIAAAYRAGPGRPGLVPDWRQPPRKPMGD